VIVPRSSNRRKILQIISAGVVGAIVDRVFETPFSMMNNFLYQRFVDPTLNRHTVQTDMVNGFKSSLDLQNVKCTVGTILTDFRFEEPVNLRLMRCFGQDDIAAIRSILNVIGINYKFDQDFEEFFISINKGVADLLAIGGQFTNSDIFKIFSRLRGHRLELSETRRYVDLQYVFRKETNLSPIRRILSGVHISEKHVTVLGRSGEEFWSDLNNDGSPKTGYLVVTKFPHPIWHDRKVIHVGGNTGPATEAVSLLFSGDFIKSAEAEEFKSKMSSFPACQTVFRCSDLKYNNTDDLKQRRHVFTNIEMCVKPMSLGVINYK